MGHQWRTTCPARSSRPAYFAGSPLRAGCFPASASARTTRGETATLNRAMTIPVTGTARLAKPEAPRAAGRTRRPRGCRGFHRTRRGRRRPMARRGLCAARRGRRPMRSSRGSGPTSCRPGGGGSPRQDIMSALRHLTPKDRRRKALKVTPFPQDSGRVTRGNDQLPLIAVTSLQTCSTSCGEKDSATGQPTPPTRAYGPSSPLWTARQLLPIGAGTDSLTLPLAGNFASPTFPEPGVHSASPSRWPFSAPPPPCPADPSRARSSLHSSRCGYPQRVLVVS